MAEALDRIYVRLHDDQRSIVHFVSFSDDARCGFRFRYFARDGRWRMWLLALDGTQLAGPIKLAPGVDLLAGCKHLDPVPQGQLFVYSPDGAAPTADTVDVDAVLYYRAVSA